MLAGTDILSVLLVGILTAVAFWTVIYGVLLMVRGHDARVRSRVKRFVTARVPGEIEEGEVDEAAQLRTTLFAQLDSRWEGRSVFNALKEDLDKADVHLTVTELVLIQV